MYVSLRIIGLGLTSSLLGSTIYVLFPYVSVGYPWDWAYALPIFMVLLHALIRVVGRFNSMLMRISVVIVTLSSLSYIMFDEYSMSIIMLIYSFIYYGLSLMFRKTLKTPEFSIKTSRISGYRIRGFTLFCIVSVLLMLLNFVLLYDFATNYSPTYLSINKDKLSRIINDILWCYNHKNFLNTLRLVGNDGFGFSFINIYNKDIRSVINILGLVTVTIILSASLVHVCNRYFTDNIRRMKILQMLVLYVLIVGFEVAFKYIALSLSSLAHNSTYLSKLIYYVLYALRNPTKLDLILLYTFSIITALTFDDVKSFLLKRCKWSKLNKSLEIAFLLFVIVMWSIYSAPITFATASYARNEYYWSLDARAVNMMTSIENKFSDNYRIMMLPYNHTIELILRPLNRITGLEQQNILRTIPHHTIIVINKECGSVSLYSDYLIWLKDLLSIAGIFNVDKDTFASIPRPSSIVYIPDLLLNYSLFPNIALSECSIIEKSRIIDSYWEFDGKNFIDGVIRGVADKLPKTLLLIVKLNSYGRTHNQYLLRVLNNNKTIAEIYYGYFGDFYISIYGQKAIFDTNGKNYLVLPEDMIFSPHIILIKLNYVTKQYINGTVLISSLSCFSNKFGGKECTIAANFYVLYKEKNTYKYNPGANVPLMLKFEMGSELYGRIYFVYMDYFNKSVIISPCTNRTLGNSIRIENDSKQKLIVAFTSKSPYSEYEPCLNEENYFCMIRLDKKPYRIIRYNNLAVVPLRHESIEGIDVENVDHHVDVSLAPLIMYINIRTSAHPLTLPLVINMRVPFLVPLCHGCGVVKVKRGVANLYGTLITLNVFNENAKIVIIFPLNIVLLVLNLLWLLIMLFVFTSLYRNHKG